ncbi:MAG: LLM class flavin-dependent oxidoreductase [Acidobacteriota bacterium]
MSIGIPISILDLSPIVTGGTAAESFRNTLDLAQHAEKWGYHRYWLAEHHNMAGIASAATSVVIGHVAGNTSSIRVGSGGIMLPNHAPLLIAEQFGTLESLYPGRIDLGIGRAPGTDPTTTHALRRDLLSTGESFPQDLLELQSYFTAIKPGQQVRAIPGTGLGVPIWLLGSSLYSAQLAAHLGLPFAFASHFAPDYLLQALSIYRALFKPSETLSRPYVMPAVNVFAADTAAEGARLATSVQQAFLNLRKGNPGQLSPPVDSMEGKWSDAERAGVEHALKYTVTGSPEMVAGGLRDFIELTKADELIITAHIHNHSARLRSFELVSTL